MALQIRRGPTAQRASILLQNGEVAWTTDTKKLYVGDGVTTGGVNILANIAGTGFVWNPSTEQLDLAGSTITGINADNVAETNGVVPRLWYRSSLGKTHASEIFTTVAGAAHSGISFSWDDVNQKLSATVSAENPVDVVAAALVAGVNTGISFIYGLTQDAAVSGAGRIDATVSSEYIQDTVNDLITAGVHTGITFTYSDSLNALSASVDSEYIQDQIAALLAASTHSGITFTYNDSLNTLNVSVPAPTLGGNLASSLVLNSYNITGTGNINIVGNVTSTKTITQTIEDGTTFNDGISLKSSGTSPLNIYGIGTFGPTSGQVYVNINAAKGTIAAPTTTAAGDVLGGILIQGYNGTNYKTGTYIVAGWDVGAVLSDIFPKSIVKISVGSGGSTYSQAILDSRGVFAVPVLSTTVYSTAGTAIPSAVTMGQGARAFVSDATVATFATAYTGGGANIVPVYSDGAVWRIG